MKQYKKNKTAVIGAVGLGYIGLSLLEAFGKQDFGLVDVENKQFTPSAHPSVLDLKWIV